MLQATGELKQDIGGVQETLEQQGGAQSAFFARADEHFSEIRALLSLAVQTMTAAAIDRAELEQLFEVQTDELSRLHEEALDRVFAKQDQPALDRPLPSEAPDAGREVTRQLGPGADASTPRAPRDPIAALRDQDAVAADLLQEILDGGGAFAVATAIKQGQLEEGPPELLVAAAKLVADAGFTAEAESAYLRAARLLEEPRARARQYVRASAMATLQRAPDRSKRHMDAARELAPDHPALLLAEARTSSDSQFMLDHVADVEPESDTERALLHQTRPRPCWDWGAKRKRARSTSWRGQRTRTICRSASSRPSCRGSRRTASLSAASRSMARR